MNHAVNLTESLHMILRSLHTTHSNTHSKPGPCRQQALRSIIFSALTAIALFGASALWAHAGSLDQNGGHYQFNSYHCHLGGCEMPDTFNRVGRDSLLIDRRGREKFFNEDDWNFEQDFDNDCQSTRQEMLVLTSRVEARFTNPRNCIVRTGEWLDEYTGDVFTVATQVDIDHVIPRLYAHTHGGDRWPQSKKIQFSNDPLNLMIVEKREIRRKSNRGPSRYLPRKEFQCEYARLWRGLAAKYDLDIDQSDNSALKKIESGCGSD